jgi:anti-sigma-K factor RskA
MTEVHVDDLLPAYALDSLDQEETLRVTQHLASCPACREALHAYQNVVEALPLGVPVTEPPPALRHKILNQLETKKSQPSKIPPQNWIARFRDLFSSTPAWGWVGVTLILILGVSNILLWQQLDRRPNPATFNVFTLQGTENQPEAEGILILEKEGNLGTLIVNELHPLDESQQYQLWLIAGEDRTSGGVFSVTERGYGRVYISLPEPLSSYSGLGITIEPAGGSPGPTGTKVLGMDL